MPTKPYNSTHFLDIPRDGDAFLGSLLQYLTTLSVGKFF